MNVSIYSGGELYYFDENNNFIVEKAVQYKLQIIPISKLNELQINELLTEPIKPLKSIYNFERIWYKKEVIVQGFKGFVEDYIDYINGKSYYEYPENSYERKNWRNIEYENKNYNKNLELYYYNLKLYLKNKDLINNYKF